MPSRHFRHVASLLLLGLAARALCAQTAPAATAPADAAKDVPINTKLTWKPVEGAMTYDVYFGAVKENADGLALVPQFQCRVTKPEFLLETLSAGVRYGWAIDAIQPEGTPKEKPLLWHTFTTAANPDRDAIFAWPIRMADTVRALYPTPDRVGDWNYTQGMVCDALISIATRTGRDNDIDFAKAWADRFVQPDGTITWANNQPFDTALHSLDRIRPGPVLLWLYDRTKEEKYKKAAAFVAGLLDQQPKTSDGGYWHRQTYPNQMWLDGIYMADVFSAEYAAMANQPKYFDEACKQILLIAQHTRDPKTGLFYHGWDETKSRPWANKDTGASPEFWGRADGWYGMAMADILEWLPSDHPQRAAVLKIFQDYCAAVAKVQDHDTGMWWQILDKPTGPKNYVETSCSLMFCQALAKGVQHGWIDAKYLDNARRGLRGILNKEIDLLPNNRLDIRGTVTVGSLGGNGGFYDYYVGVGTTLNDQKSLGAMMYLSLTLSDLANPPATPATLPRKGP